MDDDGQQTATNSNSSKYYIHSIYISLIGQIHQNGENQANCQEINRRQSTEKAIGDQSGPQIGSINGRGQECEAIPSRNRGFARDPKIPEIDGAVDAEAAVPAIGKRDCRRFQE